MQHDFWMNTNINSIHTVLNTNWERIQNSKKDYQNKPIGSYSSYK